MSDYKKVIAVLESAKETIAKILTRQEDQHHALRLSHFLQREINNISLITGIGDVAPTEKPSFGPATSIAGEKIVHAKKVQAEDLNPKEEKVNLLKQQVDDTYKTFLKTESKELVKLDHLVIRGVAKKAGMKVTKNDPEKITSKFIDEIKEAIKKEDAVLATKIADAEGKVKAAAEIHEGAKTALDALNATVPAPEASVIEQAQTALEKAAKDQADAEQVLAELKSKLA